MFSPADMLEQSQWDTFWVPRDTVVTSRPEVLYLQCARRVDYLNTVLRIRATGARLDAVIDEVRKAHRGSASRWFVPDTFDLHEVEAKLHAAGYEAHHVHEARCMRVEDYKPPTNGVHRVHAIDAITRLRDAIGVYDLAFDRQTEMSEDALREDLAACTGDDRRVYRYVAYDREGTPVASAGMNVFPRLGFGFLWGGGTIATARGRGAYAALVAARLEAASRLGLAVVGLYARKETSAPIVSRLGFEHHGIMTDWVAAL